MAKTPGVRVAFVELEPAPYKFDLFNALAESSYLRTRVFFTCRRDWDPLGCHDFRDLPPASFDYEVFSGRGLAGEFAALAGLVRGLLLWRPSLVVVSGYERPARLALLLLLASTATPLAFRADTFIPPKGFAPRQLLKRLVLWTLVRRALLVLVCGSTGRASAMAVGFPEHRVVDFPYAVSRARLEGDEVSAPRTGPGSIFFSGRLVPRKGLDVLLEALGGIRDLPWTLLVEGAGPGLSRARQLVARLGISERVSFAGFQQLEAHAQALRAASIVVVPSLDDPWGIVVDEGMALGKAVCASRASGAAVARIRHEVSGLLHGPGDVETLRCQIRALLGDPELRRRLGAEARSIHEAHTPERNRQELERALAPLLAPRGS